MRKTLLIAAAALAASVISSEAQVYSQNIVGYANVPTTTGFLNYALSIPFKIGVSNGANEIFGNNLPDGSQILKYNQGTGDYDSYNSSITSSTGWRNGVGAVIPAPVLPVGVGFFLVPGDDNVTNTFAGNVAIDVGTTNVMTFPTGFINYMVGCAVPYAGSATNGLADNKGVNLNGLPDGSQVLKYNQGTGDYDSYNSSVTSSTGWRNGVGAVIAPPVINIAEGFFLVPGDDNAVWKQSL